MYYKYDGSYFLLVTLYVDDILFFGNSKDVIHDLKSYLSSQFDMKDFGFVKYITGIEVRRNKVNIRLWLIHNKYVKYVL